jgi:hypothetical protein
MKQLFAHLLTIAAAIAAIGVPYPEGGRSHQAADARSKVTVQFRSQSRTVRLIRWGKHAGKYSA